MKSVFKAVDGISVLHTSFFFFPIILPVEKAKVPVAIVVSTAVTQYSIWDLPCER